MGRELSDMCSGRRRTLTNIIIMHLCMCFYPQGPAFTDDLINWSCWGVLGSVAARQQIRHMIDDVSWAVEEKVLQPSFFALAEYSVRE